MNIEQFSSLIVGMVTLAVGLKAIVTRKVSINLDSKDEPSEWVYGWRAVAIGGAAVLAAGLLFAAAAGFIPLFWSAHDS